MNSSPEKKISKTIELAFGSRPTKKPPPYSEIEHIGVEDIKFALYLANCDTEDTTVRRSRSTDESPSVYAPKKEEGENKCTRPGCLDIIRKINASGKKNKDERNDIYCEQQIADEELKDIEAFAKGLEEEFAKVESDSNSFEVNKTEVSTKFKEMTSKKEAILKSNLDLTNRIMIAQSERSKCIQNIQVLSQTISNLMWKGKRLSTAEENASRLYIPHITITQASPQVKEKADSISSTSYYALVRDDNLDQSERAVITTSMKQIVPGSCNLSSHYLIPGCSSSVASPSKSLSGSLKLKSKMFDDNSTIPTLTTSVAEVRLNPKKYRNSTSLESISPYPSFTQPTPWGKNQRVSLESVSPSSSFIHDEISSIGVKKSTATLQGSPSSASKLERSASPFESSRYLLINQKATPTNATRSSKSPKSQTDSIATPGFEQLFTGSVDIEDDATVRSNLTDDESFFRSSSDEKKSSNHVRHQIEPFQLLDPIFYLEKARLNFAKETRVGMVRCKGLIGPKAPSILDDESLKSHDLTTVVSQNSSGSMSTDISTGSRYLLTYKCLPRKRAYLAPVVPHQKEFQKWKTVGKKVEYPGRPPTKIG